MTVAQVAERKSLYRRLRNLSDEDARRVLQYIDDLEGHEPNAETIAALREAEDLDALTACTDLQDMLRKCGVNR